MTKAENGSLIFLLHAHLPFVRHPEHEYFLEENWFYEAAVETYIPLAEMLTRMIDDGHDFGIALSLSPTLIEMSFDPLLRQRLKRHIDNLLELTEKEIGRNRKDSSLAPLSKMYNERIKRVRELYETRGLLEPFNRLSETGKVELLTTSATHAFLPNLSPFPWAVKEQIESGIDVFKRRFGYRPSGFWLPECGYYEGLGDILTEAGVKYSFLDGRGVLNGRPRAKYGIFRPVKLPSGAAMFGRDEGLSKLVWCSKTGYPGDPSYRDFYRDIGYDLPAEDVRPLYFSKTFTGVKYYRITGKSAKKMPYIRERALKTTKKHALDFIQKAEKMAEEVGGYGFDPVFTAAFDAELFGHWWFEGIEWLENLIKTPPNRLKMATPTKYLGENIDIQTQRPAFSSWGFGGYGGTWINPSNDWAVERVHGACRKLEKLLKTRNKGALINRVIRQARRELLLAEASDWPFLISSGTAGEYAERRIEGHLDAFDRLCDMSLKRRIDKVYLEGLEARDGVILI